MIHAYASQPHYADHLWPLWASIPPERRGRMMSRRRSWWGQPTSFAQLPEGGVIMVASYIDAVHCHGRGRRLIHVEHGAGQSYRGDVSNGRHPSYAGGGARELEAVELFLTPGEAPAQLWRQTYPAARVEAIGCPKLDHWISDPPARPPSTTVGWTWHWECMMIPETRSAFEHYRRDMSRILAQLQRNGVTVIGHAHPRSHNLSSVWHDAWGIEFVKSLDEVMARCGVLVADNTSAMYEFAALGRPVITLNAPWYRRDVEHGLRFWSHIPGRQVDGPDDVVAAVMAAVRDVDDAADLRDAAVGHAYARLGDATPAAVELIMEVA